jgi:hypothetical protein
MEAFLYDQTRRASGIDYVGTEENDAGRAGNGLRIYIELARGG